MKRIALSLVMLLSIGFVNAENLFPNNNPFPQTSPQTMNNIYESEPAVINTEQKKAKRCWFKNKTEQTPDVNDASKIPVYPVPHEDAQDNGNYYMFSTGQ